jgi:hypothetical protein
MLAHVAGIPIEETVLGFVPLAAIGVAALAAAGRRLAKLARPAKLVDEGAEAR